jgi:hypothetical protein
LFDNAKAVVLERRGHAIRFHPDLLSVAGAYHIQPRLCAVGKGNEKAWASHCTSSSMSA